MNYVNIDNKILPLFVLQASVSVHRVFAWFVMINDDIDGVYQLEAARADRYFAILGLEAI